MRVLVCVFACVLLAGCQTVKYAPMNETAAAQLQGKSYAVAHYPKTDFLAFTAGKAAFAVVGVAAMVGAGNALVKKHNIPDPAVQIADTLGQQLAARKGLKRIETETVAAKETPDALVATYPGVDYVLDVRTMGWGFAYYPSKWDRYRILYQARFRLIDATTKKSVAESACSTVQGDDKNPPTKDQLLENDAALLKSYLAKAAVGCVDVLSREILKFGPAPATPAVAAAPAPAAPTQ